MIVKICGVRTYDDALMAARAGADMLGLNFHKPSPRYIEPADAAVLCDRLRDELGVLCPVLVGIFANESVGNLTRIVGKVGLDFAQLSGDESDTVLAEMAGKAFKAIRPMNLQMAMDDVGYYGKHFPTDDRVPSLVLDAYHPKLYGGTGEQASTEVALAVKDAVPRLMLAGGLKPANVAERVAAVMPWGVDVASGVESEPGRKDPRKTANFIEAAKNAALT